MNEIEPARHVERRLRTDRSRVLGGLARNPTLALTLAYLLVSGIGLAYSWRLLHFFGVNILYYADIQDFLVAAVRRPISIGTVLVVFGLTYLAVRGDLWLRENVGWYRAFDRSLRMDAVLHNLWLVLALLLVTSSLYVFRAADHEARAIRRGEGTAVEVALREVAGPPDRPADETDAPGARGRAGWETRFLVASTSRYVFLYDHAAERLEIVPYDNIALLRPVDHAVREPVDATSPQTGTPAADSLETEP